MVAILFFNYCISIPSKQFACLQNRFFRYFLPFLLNSSLKRTNIWMGSCICFVFKNALHSVIKRGGGKVWAKSSLISVLSVFSWTFNSLVCFLIDVARSFLIAVARAIKSIPSFSIFNSPFSLKTFFLYNIFP